MNKPRACILGATAVWLTDVVVVWAGGAEASGPPGEVLDSARSLVKLLWAILLLVIIFLTGLFVLRSLRRTRQRLPHAPAEPTELSDAWSLHRLPDDAASEPNDEPPA